MALCNLRDDIAGEMIGMGERVARIHKAFPRARPKGWRKKGRWPEIAATEAKITKNFVVTDFLSQGLTSFRLA